jgi:VIT1/CCC1 family predicted Fe2+/Mn2+ transporter
VVDPQRQQIDQGLLAARQWIGARSDADLDAVARESELGQRSFAAAADKLRAIRKLLEGLIQQDPNELPSSVMSSIQGQLQQLDSTVNQIRSFAPTQPDAENMRTNLITQVEGMREWFAQTVRPQLRSEITDAIARSADVEIARQTSREAAAEAEQILQGLRGAAGVVGANTLSGYYNRQAEEHGKQARRYLCGIAVSLAAVIFLGLYSFVVEPPSANSGGDDWQTFGRGVFVRLFVLALAGYVTTFLTRNYRVAKHLQVVNEEKRNALNTYSLFAQAATTAEAQNIVTAELVRAVFGASETGFLGGSGERTVIETNPSLIGLLRQS